MKYDAKTKTMDYSDKERKHVFSSFPKDKSKSKALHKAKNVDRPQVHKNMD